MTDKAIEAAARAVMMARPNGGCIVQDWEKEARDNPHVETAINQAQAAISAYLTQREADGFVMVPVEPSEGMIDAFVSRALQVSIHGEGGWSEYGRNQWQQMIAASPQVKP